MVNTSKLKLRISEAGKTQGDCATAIGIKTPTFNQKLHNIRPFKLAEAEILSAYLEIPDKQFADYFFT